MITVTYDNLEKEIDKIEKLGYQVAATEQSCQIWRISDNSLVIDADFKDTLLENAKDAINAFWE